MENSDEIQYLERCLLLTEQIETDNLGSWSDTELSELENISLSFEEILSGIENNTLLRAEKILQYNFPLFWNKICEPGKEVKTFSFEVID